MNLWLAISSRQKFALLEERVILSTVLRRFRIEAAQSPSDIRLQ
ncbi:hypothetical protein B566_EDAN010991, partial [Ephemera danica]